MEELIVRIIELEPISVAAAHGFGETPETIANEKILSWARSKGFLENIENHRFFGFNNPNPSPGSPNYGYDCWMTVDSNVQQEGDIKIIEFSGGLYAVTRCTGVPTITATWHKLIEWREDSKYKSANHQWLEELFNPLEPDIERYEFDLYMPIRE